MKAKYLLVILSLGVVSLVGSQIYLGSYLKDKYVPKRNEWARLAIKENVSSWIGSWERRYVADVIISDDEKSVSILISLANGQEPLTFGEVESATKTIQSVANSSVEQFRWLKGYKVTISIIPF